MSAVDVLAPDVRAYLNELGADIAANGGPSGDVAADMAAAHERRRSFAKEMLDGRSDRSKQVRRAISQFVFAKAHMRTALIRCNGGEA